MFGLRTKRIPVGVFFPPDGETLSAVLQHEYTRYDLEILRDVHTAHVARTHGFHDN